MIIKHTLVMTLSLFLCCVATTASATEINDKRAKFNYQMLCQGCHTPDGSGFKDVPQIKGFIGNFLANKKGREYLVRVPGSANSALNDKDLAEVLNWIILEMGDKSIPKKLQRYTADEVAKLRQNPLFEVVEYRNNYYWNYQKITTVN